MVLKNLEVNQNSPELQKIMLTTLIGGLSNQLAQSTRIPEVELTGGPDIRGADQTLFSTYGMSNLFGNIKTLTDLILDSPEIFISFEGGEAGRPMLTAEAEKCINILNGFYAACEFIKFSLLTPVKINVGEEEKANLLLWVDGTEEKGDKAGMLRMLKGIIEMLQVESLEVSLLKKEHYSTEIPYGRIPEIRGEIEA